MDGMQQWPAEAIQLIKQLQQEIEKLKKEVANLKNRLKAYENPHTPSSMQRFKSNTGGTNPPGRRGAPPGHHGATRTTPEPDEIIPVTMDHCPRCGSYLGAVTNIEHRTIEDLPPPQHIKVTRYDLHHYHCPGCGTEITATHPNCPQQGNFGIRLMTTITLMKFHQRGVLRRIQDALHQQYELRISPKGVQDILLRVGDACAPEYERLLQQIRAARWRHADETSMSVMGKNHWLWIFRTEQDDVLAVIRPSRGKKVLEEILGTGFQGAMVNDGYSSYQSLPVVQRCWAHLLREVDHGVELSDIEQRLAEEVHRRFDALKAFIGKDPPMNTRIKQKTKWDQELETLADDFVAIPETRVKAQYLKNGLGSWHTCLLHPGMQPTNNLAEQAIREHVIMRKIIGCFRSARGPENYERIASVLATWRLQGKDMSGELETLLKREMCLSWS
jgi:transposase